MKPLLKNSTGALAACALMFLLSSCATYNEQALEFYSNMQRGDYETASKQLDHNRLLRKDRNHLLYLLEKGKMTHLLNQHEASNQYFNEADQIMEDAHTSARDIALGTLLNPMMKSYKGEHFEKYMVHYYKALNYLQLNQPDEALVEARRISLRTYAQEDKIRNGNHYASDAFSMILQGLIYERSGDVNNAFIAYRNAVDLYLQRNGVYYGTGIPVQLKKDLFRTAYQNGFMDELQRYEQLLQMKFDKQAANASGELVLFWENGLAPVKTEQNLFFSLVKTDYGSFVFVDQSGFYRIPFDFSSAHYNNNTRLKEIRTMRVAIPKYQTQPPVYTGGAVTLNHSPYAFEPVQNINELAFATLNERMVKELAQTLTRIALKKLAEEAVRIEKKEKETKEEKKKREQQEAVALGLQIFSFASEKADTRNWQSLPHTIYYTRLPLEKGENQLSIDFTGTDGQKQSKNITINNTGVLQFYNTSTVR